MSSLLRLLKIEPCPSEDNLMSVLYEVLDEVLEVERTRTSVHKGHIVHRETRLERRILVEHVEHHVRISVLLQTDYDTDTLHGCLVVDICDSLDLLALYKLSNLLDHLALVDHVRNLSHNDCLTS